MTTQTKLSAIALTAVLTTLALASAASANTITKKLPPGTIGTVTAKPLPTGIIGKLPPGTLCKIGSACGPKPVDPPPPPHICPLTTGCSGPPRPTPVGGDGDHDGHGDHHHWGYGWYRHYHDRPEVIVEGAPGEVVVPGPAPVLAARAAVAAPQVVQAPCNCLTKQTLNDGSVLFQDICTKEAAVAAPQAASAR